MQLRVKEVAMHYFFAVYDYKDECKFIFDDVYELSNFVGQRPTDIVKQFNRHSSYVIPLIIGKKIYRLYMFIR